MSVKRPQFSHGSKDIKVSRIQKFGFRLRIYPAQLQLRDALGKGLSSEQDYTASSMHWSNKSMFKLIDQKVNIPNWRNNFVVRTWDDGPIDLDLRVQQCCDVESLEVNGNSFVIIQRRHYKAALSPAERVNLANTHALPPLWNGGNVIQVFLDQAAVSPGSVVLDDTTIEAITTTLDRVNNLLAGHLHFEKVTNAQHIVSSSYILVVGIERGRSNSRIGRKIGSNIIHLVTGSTIRGATRSFIHELLHILGLFHSQQYSYIQPFLFVDFAKIANEERHDYTLVPPEYFHQPGNFRLCTCSVMLYSARHGRQRILTWTGRREFEDFGRAEFMCEHEIQFLKILHPIQVVDRRMMEVIHSHNHLQVIN